jgi:hypothetical protein
MWFRLARAWPTIQARRRRSPAAADRRPRRIEDYFREISAAPTNDERHRIGERYGIRVVPG